MPRRERLRRRPSWGVVLGLLAVLAVAVAVAGVSAWHDLRPVRAEVLSARDKLLAANDPAAFVSPERRAASLAGLSAAQTQLSSARRRLRRSPAIWLAQLVPGLRRQRAGLLSLVDDARRGSAAAGALLGQAQSLADRGQVRDGAIPLDGLQRIATEAGRAGRVFRSLQRPAAGLWGPLRSARRRLDEVAASTASRLSQASDTLGATPGFLGAGGERRYLLAMLNNAEMRDQGMVLSYGILRFAGGRYEFERRGTIADLRLDRPTATAIPPGTQAVFGANTPTLLWQSVNATADFEWSGRAMVDMYAQATGQHVDGVVAIDVPGLANLLTVVGPVTVAGVAEPISADNAGRVLLHDLYEGLAPLSDQGPRRERLAEVAGAVIDRLTTGSRDLVGLGSAFTQASTGGHLRLWSSVPGEEQVFVRSGLGGGPAASEADRTFHVAVENRTPTKVDYHVRPTVRQEVELGRDGTAVVRTTVVVDNQAPVGAPPSYALGPNDEFTKNPGDYLAWILLWGPSGATQAFSTEESGLLLSNHVALVPAGQQREAVFTTTIPRAVRDGRLTLRLVPQPRLQPMALEVHLRAPGWRVTGAPDWKGPWDQVRRVSWKVER